VQEEKASKVDFLFITYIRSSSTNTKPMLALIPP